MRRETKLLNPNDFFKAYELIYWVGTLLCNNIMLTLTFRCILKLESVIITSSKRKQMPRQFLYFHFDSDS